MGVKAIDTSAPWYIAPGSNGTNFMRQEAQKFAREIVESEDYKADIRLRAKTGKLAPAIEAMLWYYAYGKPLENIAMTISPGQEDLSNLSMEELVERASKIKDQLEEASALAAAIPADVLKGPWAPPSTP